MNANVSSSDGLIIAAIETNHSTSLTVISYHWPALFLLFFSFAGILGNVLVCLAISTERRLHNRTNWFLFSLAFADLLVSGLVIPLAIVKEFTGFWILGPFLCDLWIFFDVCSCTSSIMHIVVISIDRYLAINDPLNVRSRQGNYQILFWIGFIWSVAILLSSPMIILGMINPYNIIINGQCLINNHFFVIYGSVVSFVIPLIIVIVMYILTVRRLKEQIRQCQRQFAQEQLMSTANLLAKPFLRRPLTSSTLHTSSQAILISSGESRRQRLQQQPNSLELSEASLDNLSLTKEKLGRTTTTTTKKISPHAEYACPNNPFCQLKCTCQHLSLEPVQEGQNDSTCQQYLPSTRSRPARPLSCPSSTRELSSTPSRRQRQWTRLPWIPTFSANRSKSSAIRNERKAVKVLGVVFVIFVIAWFPFCILNILHAVCKRCAINGNLLNGFVWLGYVSSSINPLVYTIFNRNFRLKFLALLQCQCLYPKDRQRQLSFYTSHSSLYNLRFQRNNDLRRLNPVRPRSETVSS